MPISGPGIPADQQPHLFERLHGHRVRFVDQYDHLATGGVQRDQTHKIDSAARTLLAILDDLLDYSKLETGRINIEQRPFLLREVLGDEYDQSEEDWAELYGSAAEAMLVAAAREDAGS